MTESLEADLARLRTDLAGVRDVLAQRDRALVAAHRAIEIAQVDVAALEEPIERLYRWHAVGGKTDYGLHGPGCDICDVVRGYRAAHPGAPMLAELDAARAVVASARDYKAATDTLDGIGFAEHALFAAVADYDRAMKARET